MKKLIYLVVIISLFLYCFPKQEKIEKIIEDGVEVVLNHTEPYKVKGEPVTLTIEEEFSIDTEKEKMLDIGLTGIETFDTDSEGNIYVIQWQARENFIFKFDKEGNYLVSFCKKGQGPGEIEYGGNVLVNPKGEIIAKDPSKRKFALYDRKGNFLNETQMKKVNRMLPLENGKYFVFWIEDTPELRKRWVGVSNSEFENIKELDFFQFPNPINVKSPVNRDRLVYAVSKDRIYIGNSERGYEIQVYDLDGNLMQKIRKEYEPVEVLEDYKKSYFERFPEGYPLLDKLYFAKNWPAFRNVFTDDEGRLFVLTHEEGINPGEYMYDIFNSEGVFVGRMSLWNYRELHAPAFTIKAKKNHLYCLREKESGYRELVVYNMNWE